jgi:hypothetical protein
MSGYGDIILVGITAIFIGLIFHKGEMSCGGAAALAAQREVFAYGKIEQKVVALPDAELNQRLGRWLRDK